MQSVVYERFVRLPAVLADEVKVVAADDDGVGHLARGDHEALAMPKYAGEGGRGQQEE